MTEYKFANGNEIKVNEVYECGCDDSHEECEAYWCKNKKLVDVTVDLESSDFSSSMNEEKIGELQSFLMQFWYRLEKIKGH